MAVKAVDVLIWLAERKPRSDFEATVKLLPENVAKSSCLL
jgi:hypothetical protein